MEFQEEINEIDEDILLTVNAAIELLEDNINNEDNVTQAPSSATILVPANNLRMSPKDKKVILKERVVKTSFKRNESKKKRRNGESYLSQTLKEIPAREMGPACKNNKCSKSKNTRFCHTFTEQQRREIFDLYWKLDNKQKVTFVHQLVDTSPSKHRTQLQADIEAPKKRNVERKYYLKQNCEKKQVCLKMFMHTLGLKERNIRNWTAKKCAPAISPESPRKRVTCGTRKSYLKDHLNSFLSELPAMDSHYCRRNTSKIYLQDNIRSYSALYRTYRRKAMRKYAEALSWATFFGALKKKKISIFKPRKDQCDECVAHDLGHNKSQEEKDKYLNHRIFVEQARTQMFEDSTNEDEITLVITVDVQAVLLAPYYQASAMYYKCKLQVHNFTVYNNKTKDVMCYVWDETAGGLVASIFATMLVDYLKDVFKSQKNISNVKIYSDGCGYQNRNVVLSNALLKLAVEFNIVIEHNYLEKGHTQMKVDSIHSCIEKQIKRRRINIPFDYVKCMVCSRNTLPITVQYLSHNFFQDYSKENVLFYSKIKPLKNKVVDLKCLRYNIDGNISYKLRYDQDWLIMPHKVSNPFFKYEKLYKKKIPIQATKYLHLQQLCKVIPARFRNFYKNIPHV